MRKLHLALRVFTRKLYKGKKKGWQQAAENLAIGLVLVNLMSLVLLLDFMFNFSSLAGINRNFNIPLSMFSLIMVLGAFCYYILTPKRFNRLEIKSAILKQEKVKFVHVIIVLILTFLILLFVLSEISDRFV